MVFYFKQDDADRNSFEAMARSLLGQILKHNANLLDYFYYRCCNSGETILKSRTLMEELLLFALRSCRLAYVILDGLDECCTRDERKSIVKFFRNVIEDPKDERKARNRIRCLFVSRKDSARKDYAGLPSIRVSNENNETDIATFGVVQSKELQQKFTVLSEKMGEIADKVTKFSDGGSRILIASSFVC